MIRRFATLISLMLVVAAAFGLYIVKYRVQAIQAEIAALTHQLEDERESLHVAAAEWAYLSQPERLQKLASKYLKMRPVDVSQVAAIEDVPYASQMVAQPQPQPNENLVPASASIPGDGE